MFGWWSIALAADVTLSLERYRALVGEERAVERPPEPFVARRDLVVRRVGDALRVTATWRVEVPGRAAVALRLAGPELGITRFTVDGRPGALSADAEGAAFVAVLERPVTLSLEGTLPDAPELDLALLGAGAGEVALPPDRALRGGVEVAPGRWIAAAPEVVGIVERPVSDRDRGVLVTGQVGYGVTVGDGEVRRVAHLRWSVRSGALATVAFTVPGAGPDLRVEGPQVAAVERVGDRVVVSLGQPETARVDLVVRSSSALAGGDVAAVDLAPPVLEGVFRSESALVLARDGELDLLPSVSGAAPAPLSGLPDWAQGLVDGVTTAAFRGPAAQGRVDAVRYTPTAGPATLCDVASLTVALSPEGRALVRAHYTIRNDRGHLLRVTPPPGFAPISAQVGGEPVTVSRDGDAWLLPLEKSLETVEGLLTFPVELAFLAESDGFRARDRRVLPLPALDVETAVTRVTVHLPPGWEDRGRIDTEDRVADFTEGRGVSYGFAVGDVRAATAEMYFQDALDSWYANDFHRAQQALDAIRGLGGDNENVLRLQSNLDVVAGKRANAESAADRRIKEQARARAFEDYERQRVLLEQAEAATNTGDYESADEAYRAANDLTVKLDQLANAEDAAQKVVLEETKKKAKDNASASNSKAVFRSSGVASADAEAPPPPADPDPSGSEADEVYEEYEEYDRSEESAFDDVDLRGLEVEGVVVGGVVGGVKGGAVGGEPVASFGVGAGGAGDDTGRLEDLKAAEVDVGRAAARADTGAFAPRKPVAAPSPAPRPAAPPPATATITDGPLPVVEKSVTRAPASPAAPEAERWPPAEAVERPRLPERLEGEAGPSANGPASGRVLTKDVLNRIPPGRDYQAAVQNAVGVQPGSGGNPNVSGARPDEAEYAVDGLPMSEPAPPEEPSDADGWVENRQLGAPPRSAPSSETVALRRRGPHLPPVRVHFPHRERDDGTRHVELPPAKVGVTATSASVVVPTTGVAVRYQHLLLPAGERPEVRLDSKRLPRRSSR